MAPDNGGRAAHRARRRTGATGTHLVWPVGLLVAGCAFLSMTGCSDQADDGGVALLSATSVGDLPWTDRLLPPQTPVVVPPGPPDTALPADAEAVVTGDRGGLYGGSVDRQLCDTGRLVDTLEGDPAKLSAWSKAQGVSDVPGFVASLTPVLLRADTRVTGYGYDDGRANAREAVLEAGTIVLIDEHGEPQVRCAHGEPLSPPTPGKAADPNAVPWPGFDANRMLVVRPAIDAMGTVSVVDLATGGLTTVPVGSGPAPAPAPTPETTTPPPTRAATQAAVEPGSQRAVADTPAPAAPAAPEVPQPVPEPPAPEPPAPAPAPAPAPVVVAPPPAPVAPPEIRVELPGLPPLVIPLPN